MSESAVRVLVTATGGDVGQAIIKALRVSGADYEIYGCDAGHAPVGSAFVSSYQRVPYAQDENYVGALDKLCRDLKIHVLIPGSEPEIRVLIRLKTFPKLRPGVRVVCQTVSWVETFGDKLGCMRALEGKIELAPFVDASIPKEVEKFVRMHDFPIVVKSRFSFGSRSIGVAHNDHQLEDYLGRVLNPILQSYLDEEGGEFSVGLFFYRDIRAIIAFKRGLGPAGCSWWAETSDDSEVLAYAKRIGVMTELEGSANIQLRKTRQGVRLLEINPRFSSLAAARALCGFHDVHWSIEMALGRKFSPLIQEYKQIRFRRFFSELVDLGYGFSAVDEWLPNRMTSVARSHELS